MNFQKKKTLTENIIKVGTGLFAGIPLISLLRTLSISDFMFSFIQCVFFVLYYSLMDFLLMKIESVLFRDKEVPLSSNIIDKTYYVKINEDGSFSLTEETNNEEKDIEKREQEEEQNTKLVDVKDRVYKYYLLRRNSGIDIFDPNEIPSNCTKIGYEMDDFQKRVDIVSRKICKLSQINKTQLAMFIRPFDIIENETELKQILKEITGRNIEDTVEYIKWEDENVVVLDDNEEELD